MKKPIYRIGLFLILILFASLLCLHNSCSAKVYRGTFEKNMKWSYDTKTETVTVDCKGRMDDCFDVDSDRDFGWTIAYNKAKKLVFKRGITYIGGYSFEHFTQLEEIIFPEGLVTIGKMAFWFTENLKKVEFPSTLKKVGYEAFYGSGLTTVSLRNIKHIGESAFSSTNIRRLTIPYKCKDIKNGAFEDCSKLKSVIFLNPIKKIGKDMFFQTELESVTIPASVTEVGSMAFGTFAPQKSRLKRVTIKSTQIKKWGKDIFGEVKKDLIIKVPKCRLKEYTKVLRKGGLPKYVKIVAE